jgi:hypothetical protein
MVFSIHESICGSFMVTVKLSPSITFGHMPVSAAMTVDATAIAAAATKTLSNILRVIFMPPRASPSSFRKRDEPMGNPAHPNTNGCHGRARFSLDGGLEVMGWEIHRKHA